MDLAQLRTRVTEALQRMEAANTALTEAGEDADTDALTRAFDTAEAEHRTAVVAFERAERVEEARTNAPVEPVEEEDDPEDEADAADAEGDEDNGERKRSLKVRVRKEPLTYERANQNDSNIFRDMLQARHGDGEAAERLQRHRQEMDVELTAEQRAHPNQAAGEGGEFIAPVWLQNEWLNVPRAGRAIADSLGPRPLPANTNQINIPKLATGSTTAVQTDNGSVSSTDVTTGSVTGQVQTVAGQQDASMQLHELSGPGIQEVIMDDLTRSYDQTLDQSVISGAVSNAKGILNVSGINAVTFTQATPTLPLLYPKIADAIQRVNTGRFLPPSVIALHPRRWGFALASQDTTNRPLIVPTAPQNPPASISRVAAEGIVGSMQGMTVIQDANLPITEGTGTNQDPILVYRPEDIYFWETPVPRFRVLEEVLSGNLQVRYQLYGYYALIAGRYPKAISTITGTGNITPSF